MPRRRKAELLRIADDRQCSILSWFEGSGYDTQTFHFKAVSADSRIAERNNRRESEKRLSPISYIAGVENARSRQMPRLF